MIRRHLRVSLWWALAALVAGCSSTVGSAVPTYGNSAPSTPVPTAPVAFTVSPGLAHPTATRNRKPAYLSPLTLSVSIVPIVTGAPNQPPTVIDLGAGVSGCTGSGASLACTGTVTAPIGETSFTVTAFGSENAKGAVLSVGTIAVDVLPSSTGATISNATSLTLGGVPASFGITASPDLLTVGTASTIDANVAAYDASGSTIIGPVETITPYESADDSVLTVANGFIGIVPGCAYPTVPNVTSCHIITAVLGPSQALILSYAGEYVPGTSILLALESPGLATKTLKVSLATPPPNGGCTGAVIVVCPGQVTFADSSSPGVPLTVTETGVTTFTASDAACVGAGVASINFQKMTSGDSFTVYPGDSAGTCTATFTDAKGHTTDLNIALLNSQPTPTPSPTFTPTPIPTQTPTPAPIAIAPSDTIVFASSTAAAQTMTASEAGYHSFTLDQTQCAGIVSVTPSTGTIFTITPAAALGQGGKCTLVVSNSTGQSAQVQALVDGTSIIINARKR